VKTQPPAAIVFDFDGVIVDSETAANRALADMLCGIGLPTTVEESLALYCGHRWSDCLALIERNLGRPLPDDFRDRYSALARPILDREMTAVTGIAAFLDDHCHLPLAIASSSTVDWLHHCLSRFALDHYFGGHVYSATGLERGKPHPDIYLHAAAQLNVDPRRMVVIEDSVIGASAGVAAGAMVIGFAGASHVRAGHAERLRAAGVHHVAADFAQAAQIIASLG